MGIVYKITNTVTGKSYVGLTQFTLEVRWSQHCSRAEYEQTKSILHSAIKKYGQDTFQKEILFESDSWAALCQAEREFIEALNTLQPYGYNLIDGGQGRIWTAEEKLEQSQRSPTKRSQQAIQNIANGAKRRAADPIERKLRSERAKRQHAEGKLGVKAWTPEGRERVRVASASGKGIKAAQEAAKKGQTSEKMSRRSYCRKIFQEPE